MEIPVTITPKFQVHIPVKARKLSGISSHGRATMKVSKGKITITKSKKSILDWAGAFKVKSPIPADKIRDYIDYSR